MMASAREILARGDCVLIFPEGTRVRPGSLGRPKRGVGRLALETGAPVVPVAVIGTEAVRRGWRIRPHKVRIRCGRPLRHQIGAPTITRAPLWCKPRLRVKEIEAIAGLRRCAGVDEQLDQHFSVRWNAAAGFHPLHVFRWCERATYHHAIIRIR